MMPAKLQLSCPPRMTLARPCANFLSRTPRQMHALPLSASAAWRTRCPSSRITGNPCASRPSSQQWTCCQHVIQWECLHMINCRAQCHWHQVVAAREASVCHAVLVLADLRSIRKAATVNSKVMMSLIKMAQVEEIATVTPAMTVLDPAIDARSVGARSHRSPGWHCREFPI